MINTLNSLVLDGKPLFPPSCSPRHLPEPTVRLISIDAANQYGVQLRKRKFIASRGVQLAPPAAQASMPGSNLTNRIFDAINEAVSKESGERPLVRVKDFNYPANPKRDQSPVIEVDLADITTVDQALIDAIAPHLQQAGFEARLTILPDNTAREALLTAIESGQIDAPKPGSLRNMLAFYTLDRLPETHPTSLFLVSRIPAFNIRDVLNRGSRF